SGKYLPVFGSSASRYSPRVKKRRSSEPLRQYATERVLWPATPLIPRSNRSCTQTVLPLPGLNASMRPTPFDAKSTPLIKIGVALSLWDRLRAGCALVSDESTDGLRHSTRRFFTLSRLI